MYFHNRDEEAATNLNSWSLSFLKTKVHNKTFVAPIKYN